MPEVVYGAYIEDREASASLISGIVQASVNLYYFTLLPQNPGMALAYLRDTSPEREDLLIRIDPDVLKLSLLHFGSRFEMRHVSRNKEILDKAAETMRKLQDIKPGGQTIDRGRTISERGIAQDEFRAIEEVKELTDEAKATLHRRLEIALLWLTLIAFEISSQ